MLGTVAPLGFPFGLPVGFSKGTSRYSINTYRFGRFSQVTHWYSGTTNWSGPK